MMDGRWGGGRAVAAPCIPTLLFAPHVGTQQQDKMKTQVKLVSWHRQSRVSNSMGAAAQTTATKTVRANWQSSRKDANEGESRRKGKSGAAAGGGARR